MSSSNPSVTRRQAMQAVAAPALGGLFGGAALAESPTSRPTAPLDPRSPSGEPYALAGRRIVFTNWFWIRPGQFAWLDETGANVTVAGSVGAWGAELRKADVPHGIRLVAEPARRGEPVIRAERPWETVGIGVATLLHDGDRYRLWARCAGKEASGFAMYESKDGIAWERPELGQVEVKGGRANNLIAFPQGSVFRDPVGAPDARYKMITEGQFPPEVVRRYIERRPDAWEWRHQRTDIGHLYGIKGAVSPDGVHWKAIDEPLVVEHSDTQIIACYDERLGKYVIYTRTWMTGPRAAAMGDAPGQSWIAPGRRSIGRTESEQFRDFPLSDTVLTPGPEVAASEVYYTNCYTRVPGAPDHHLMFPAVWGMHDDATWITVASSPDGRVWNFVPGARVLDTAPFGAWDGGCIFATPNLVELPDGRWVLPYTGYAFPHKYPRGQWTYSTGYASWPYGRLIAVEATERGEFATVGFMPPTPRVRLNVVAARGGSVRVEAADVSGNPLPGRTFADAVPVIGDQPAAPVRWKEQDEIGREGVILRFRLDRAKIYAIDFV